MTKTHIVTSKEQNFRTYHMKFATVIIIIWGHTMMLYVRGNLPSGDKKYGDSVAITENIRVDQ